MKIGLQTWGTDGDIRPFIALAGGLSSSGHDVSLVVTSVNNKRFDHYGHGLNFSISYVGKVKQYSMIEQKIHEKLSTTKMPLKQLKIVIDNFFDPVIPEMYEASKKLCQENELVIGHFLLHPLMLAAEKFCKPYITVTPNHGNIPSIHTAPIGCVSFGRLLNSLWWKFANFLIDRALIGSINRLRHKEGIPPTRNIIKNVWASNELNLLSVSRTLCRKQPDWTENNKICGFLDIPDQAADWQMPKDLKEFIEHGPEPVFLTIGSMLEFDRNPSVITEILVQGALLAGRRAIVQSCWNKLPDFSVNPDIFKINAVPHKYIFPHCSVVVHHAGAGTSHSATLYGCPSVIIEHFGDQLLFAEELRRNGVAPKVLHRRNITAKKLAKAIKFVIDNPAMKSNAESLGIEIRKENGVAKAVREIENYIETIYIDLAKAN